MLGYLLARVGVDVVVLEKHADFFRDFRGDTIHPSTMEVLDELGLADEFLALPHQEFDMGKFSVDGEVFPVVDFSRIKAKYNFIAMVPQWGFLNFLTSKARAFPGFHLKMDTEAVDLIYESGKVSGVKAVSPDGALEISAKLVVGCDGRHSTIREKAGLEIIDFGAPIDVLWMRIAKPEMGQDPVLAYIRGHDFMVLFDRGNYLQSALLIEKDSFDSIRSMGLDIFKQKICALAPFVNSTVDSIRDWNDVKLLSVRIDRMRNWSRPGLICIGDAAHAMSPAGGVGINLAIQDAVAAANILAQNLLNDGLSVADLEAVQGRREWPTKVVQRMQVMVHNNILSTESTSRRNGLRILRLVTAQLPFVRGWLARLIGYGPRPEHVRQIR